MNTYKRYFIFILFLILCITAGIIGTFYIFNENKIHLVNIIKNIVSFKFLLLIPIITFCNILFRYLRWAFLLRHFHIKVPSRELGIYFFLSFLGNLSPLYILHIIRIIPLLKRKKYKGIFIFMLDILLDILSLLFLFLMNPIIVIYLYILLIIIIMSFVLYYIDKIKKTNLVFNTTTLLIFTFTTSIIIWLFSSSTLYFAILTFDYKLDYINVLKIFAEMNLVNLFYFIPAGIYFSGKKGIEFLTINQIPLEISIYIIFVFRLFTTWTAIIIALITLIKFRKIFLLKDKHFNLIADEYTHQIPEHIRQRVLERKIQLNIKYLPQKEFPYGLDAGCGQGWYLKEMLLHSYKMKAIDYSEKQVEYAKNYCNYNKIYTASITELPFKNNEFDFIYTINVLHHLESKESQKKALDEFYRVLRPGGRLIIHEINVRNPLFRFYMSYIFPLINSIDEGIEIWVEPYKDQYLFEKFRIINIEYFTFLPDFIPKFLMELLKGIEKKLENSSLFKKYSAHYCMILEKTKI
jgi:SAM-dependent methyltransferase